MIIPRWAKRRSSHGGKWCMVGNGASSPKTTAEDLQATVVLEWLVLLVAIPVADSLWVSGKTGINILWPMELEGHLPGSLLQNHLHLAFWWDANALMVPHFSRSSCRYMGFISHLCREVTSPTQKVCFHILCTWNTCCRGENVPKETISHIHITSFHNLLDTVPPWRLMYWSVIVLSVRIGTYFPSESGLKERMAYLIAISSRKLRCSPLRWGSQAAPIE